MARRLAHERADENWATHRRATARFGVRRRRPGRFSTVWLCAQDEPVAGTGVLAGWLLDAVVKVVTTYSMPGDRVLLLGPGPGFASSVVGSGPYRGLLDAVWPVARLGRGVRTGLVGVGAESSSVGWESVGGVEGLFDVIIAAAQLRVLASMRPTRWGDVLAPRGVFAVITHGDRMGSRLFDPAGALVRAACADGLRYLDRITLVQLPLHETPGEAKPSEVRSRAHADLHVFCQSAVSVESLHEFGDLW